MAIILTLAAQKGGVGKSTLALNLYGAAQRAGLNVAAVDLDPQASLTRAARLSAAGMTLISPPVDLAKLARSDQYHLVIVDTPGWQSDEMNAVFLASSFVLIPVTPGLMDAYAIVPTWSTITDLGVPAAVVLNRTKYSSRSFIEDVRNGMRDAGMKLIQAEIVDRVSYQRSAVTGTVYGSDDQKAQEEIAELIKEIIGYVKAKN